MSTMNNFTFVSPTILCYGKGATAEIQKQHLIPEGARVMMTYGGGSIKKNGVYDEVLKYVKPVCEFGGIEANPEHETCVKAIKMAKENKIDFLLAVGGGSVIDATKYIAIAMEHTFSDDTYDILAKQGQFQPNPAKAKIGAVLTIPATGTETNMGFVVSRRAFNLKLGYLNPSVYPHFSIVDPCHSMSLPDNQVRNGIIDAFVHTIEQYIGHYEKNYVVDETAEGVMRTLIKVAQTTLKDHNDYQARANFCYAATVALNFTLAVGVDQCWAAHGIGHELTAFYGIAHGESLAMSCPGVMRFHKEKNAKKLVRMAEKVFGIKDAKPEDAIVATENFFKSIGAKIRMSEWNFTDEHYQAISSKFVGMKLGAHGDIDDKAIMTILKDI
ncbi:alcohol dehydrogenase [Entamoeba marina]